MFYYINGTLTHREASTAVLDCGGVGYKLTVSLCTSDALEGQDGKTVRLYTHLAVREDGVELYGFISEEELNAFRLLIGVSGVGPKAAMAVLSLLTPDRFFLAVSGEDTRTLAKASGVGAKTAARIVLELRDKVSGIAFTHTAPASAGTARQTGAGSGGKISEATDALTVLGYERSDILAALKDLDTAHLTTEEIITAALKKFAR